MRAPATLPLTLVLACCALAACSVDEAVSPVPITTAKVDAGEPPPAATPVTVKRTVSMRNPWGGPVGNHFYDGDFELSTTPYDAQVGWIGFVSAGSTRISIKAETGGLCRSGLRCAIFEPKTAILVQGAAPDGKAGLVSMWAKVPDGSKCNVVSAVVLDCSTGIIGKKLSADQNVGPDGWCNYNTHFNEQDSGACLYLTSSLKADTVALVDSLVMGPDDGTVSVKSAEFWVPPAELVESVQNVIAYQRRTMPFGKPAAPRRVER